MSKFLTVIGDPHLTNKNQDKVRKVLEQAEAFGDPIVLLGDLLDTKEVIRGKALNFWYDRLSTAPVPYHILVGNHDWFNLECEDHSLRVLEELQMVTIVDGPMEFHQYPDSTIWGIPYIHDRMELKKELKKIPEQAILFAHLEVAGFDFGNGYVCEGGTLLRHISKFKKVISGHFHKYQQDKNLTYLGTPFSHSFGESNQDKFIGRFNLETSEMELIPTDLPRHVTVEVELGEPGILPQIETGGKKHDYFRFILKGTQEAIDAFPRKSVEEHLDSVKWITKPTDQFQLDTQLDETQSNEAQFQKWAEEIKQLDPETAKLGLQILEGCRDL